MYDQSAYTIRCEWGLPGVTALAPISDAIIIVDVLSFSTCVDIATGRGATVYPFASRDTSAEAYAAQLNAWLRDPDGNLYLSPHKLLTIPAGTRLVLPSPNGSTLSTHTGDTPAFAGCLRNATAVAKAAQSLGRTISVIPAGERWRTDGTLRPALEDWLGAGAIIHALSGDKSPEAQAAEAAFRLHLSSLGDVLGRIGSGIELIEKGMAANVALAAEYDISTTAPRLREGAYRA